MFKQYLPPILKKSR